MKTISPPTRASEPKREETARARKKEILLTLGGRFMIKATRQQVRNLIGVASHLDALLAEANGVAELELARVAVEVNKLEERLTKVSARVEKAVPPDPMEK
jgi:hypothetical protein